MLTYPRLELLSTAKQYSSMQKTEQNVPRNVYFCLWCIYWAIGSVTNNSQQSNNLPNDGPVETRNDADPTISLHLCIEL